MIIKHNFVVGANSVIYNFKEQQTHNCQNETFTFKALKKCTH